MYIYHKYIIANSYLYSNLVINKKNMKLRAIGVNGYQIAI